MKLHEIIMRSHWSGCWHIGILWLYGALWLCFLCQDLGAQDSKEERERSPKEVEDLRMQLSEAHADTWLTLVLLLDANWQFGHVRLHF